MNTKADNNEERKKEDVSIDFIDVLIRLWRGKVTIVCCIAVSLILGVLFLKFAPKKMTSTALITQPTTEQISGYINTLGVMDGENPLTIAGSQKLFLTNFKSAFFALSSDNTKNIGGAIAFETVILDKSKVVAQSSSALIDPSLPFKITFSTQGASPQQVQKTLEELIQEVNQSTVARLKHDLAAALQTRINLLKKKLIMQEQVAENIKKSRINNIEHSLALANELNIKISAPNLVESPVQSSMFMLGSDKLVILMESEKNSPLVFSENYYSTLYELQLLESINLGDVNFNSYDYLMKPSLPSVNDGPKKPLVLILAIILGCMTGACIVLVWSVIRNRVR